MFFWRKRKTNEERAGTLEPVLIFHHIAKTAGSSLRRVLKANYKRRELLECYGPNRASVDWYDTYYHSLPYRRKAAIKCIAAHSAHYLMPVIDRPFRVFSMLRDPVDRAISLYYFTKGLAHQGETKGGIGARIGREIERLGWGLEDIYLNVGVKDWGLAEERQVFAPFFNGQSRVILAPHRTLADLPFYTETTEAVISFESTLDELLERHYVVGVTEHYEESMALFAETFGWRHVFVERKNTTRQRPRGKEIPADLAMLIRSFNQMDQHIHQRYMSLFSN